jgi:hypothetical protein
MCCHIGLQATTTEITILHEPPKLLENVALVVRARKWYIHFGALVHFSRTVRGVLNYSYNFYCLHPVV